MFDQYFRFPAELKGVTTTGAGRVAVIGGGISGLVCAYELQRRGFDVVVYERNNHPGGRIRTYRFWDGTHAELGAMRIPSNHHCTLHYVTEFGLRTRPFVNANPDAYYFLRGRRTRIRDVDELFPAFSLRGDERRDPVRLLDDLLRSAWQGLTSDQRRQALDGQLDHPTLERLMSISLWQFAREHLSPDGWELVGHTSGLVHYERASLLEVLIDYFGLFHVDQVELVEGTDALVHAFVRALRPGTIQLSTRIDEIRLTGGSAAVRGTRLNIPITDNVDFVVACVPAPALDQITIEPGLPHHQRRAVRSINYASSAKTLVHTRRRSWELVDGIFGGGSFTDLAIQQCWYPSDNQDRDVHLAHEPAVLTAAYLWEQNARRFSTLPEADQSRLVLESLEQLHPGISAEVDDIVHLSWDGQVGIGGGAFAYLAPGEHTRYLAEMGVPHPVGDPRVFFAGEHLSAAHAWIQGAVQSALAVVSHILLRARTTSAA
jgi:monoamine oxidase